MVEKTRADKINSLLARKLSPRALYNPESARYHLQRQVLHDRERGIHTYPGDWSSHSFLHERGKKNEKEQDLHQRTLQSRKETISKVCYELKGYLYTEERPIRLEESVSAADDIEAKSIARRKAKEYRDVEGYAVSFFVYNPSGKQIGYVNQKAKRVK